MSGPTSTAVPEDAELVLQAGADLEARDNKGYTPLLGAARSGRRNTSLVEYFVKKGANVDARDNEGWTVYELAAQRSSADILRHVGCGMIIHDTRRDYNVCQSSSSLRRTAPLPRRRAAW